MEETVESLKEKCRTLEAECHSLLNRAIKSEQQHVDAAAERDRAISAQNELRDEKAVLQKKVNEMRRENEDIAMNLAQLNEAMGDRDILATLEQYKADARRLNELRLKLESNFADLSVQYDTLQGEHELMSADYKSKTRDLETTLEHVSNLEGNIKALETAAAQAESDREAAYKNLELVRKELAAEVKAHLKTKDDLKRSQNSLADLRKELEGALEAAEKQKKDHDSLKKKAATWKKQAELAQELETRNEQLVVQLAYQTKELADAKALISKLQAQLVNLEEEEKKRRDNSINPKMVQYLRDQLAEAQEKIKEYKAKDKRQTELIATLEAQVKRLKLELGRKNPSQLRLMEMEVQNELLIGMLQASSPHRQPAAAKPAKSGATPPPRKLPPLESLVTAQTQTSASPTPGRVSPVPAPIIVKSTDTLKPSLAKQPTPRSLPTTPPSVAAAPSATTNSAAVAKSPKTLGATAAPPPAADTANTASSSTPPAAAEETAAADRTTADLAAAPPPAAAAPVEPSPPPPSAAPSAPQSTGNKAPKASTDDDEAEGEEEGEEEEEADDAAGGAEEDGAGAEEGDDNEEEEEEYEEDAEAEDP